MNASEAAIQVSDEAYRKGKHQQGDFARKIAIALADAAISLTPGVSWVNDVYSVVTGKSWTGEELDSFDYGMAVLGVVTAGYGSKFKYLKHADEAFEVIENVIKKAGSIADLEKALLNNKKAREVYDNMRERFASHDKGVWDGERGFSNFLPDDPDALSITGGKPIPYEGMFPRFEKWVKEGDIKSDFDGGLDGTSGDMNKVYDWIAKRENLPSQDEGRKWLRRNELTPHHLEDGRTIQLVPTSLHKAGHISVAQHYLRPLGHQHFKRKEYVHY